LNLGIIGCGVVGMATGKMLEELGHKVIYCDKDLPLLDKIRMTEHSVTDSIYDIKKTCDIIFVCVNAPTDKDGELDLSQIQSVINSFAGLQTNQTVVFRTTLLPGVMHNLNNTLHCNVLYLPEFLREKFAVWDEIHPDRIVIGIGGDSNVVPLMNILHNLRKPIHVVTYQEAELIKYASNAFFATKISFFNEIGMLANELDMDGDTVCKIVGGDHRIGLYGTQPGRPFQGFCLPKDMVAFINFQRDNGVFSELLESVMSINEGFGRLNENHNS